MMHKKQEELDYMLKTIKSSWEFVDSDRALLDSVLKHPLARRALNCYMQTKQAAAPSPGSQEYFMSQMESRKLTKRGLKLLIREEISKELK